jgi:hypothetical protein
MAVAATVKTMAATTMVGGTDNNHLNVAAGETMAVATAMALVMATETAMGIETAIVTAMLTMPMPTTAHQ